VAKLPLEKVTAGVITYFEQEVQPHLPSDGLKGFGIGFASTLALSRVGSIIRQAAMHPAVALLDVIDDKGNVDVEELYRAAMQAMPEEGIQFGVLGQQLRFYRDDLKKLHDMILQQ
jgi:hypothetical protein